MNTSTRAKRNETTDRQIKRAVAQLLSRPMTSPLGNRICNAAKRNTTYRTGDGEVIQQVRPGSMRAYGLPSRGIKA